MLLLAIMNSAYAENFQMPNSVKKINIPKEFLDHDAVILEDQIRFSCANSGVTRHLRIKILTKAGLKKYNKICLPESLDYPADNFLTPKYITEKQHLPYATPRSVLYVKARIIKSNGTFTETKVRDSSVRFNWYELYTPKVYYNYYYIFDDLKVGDEIDIYYSHREQFYDNSIILTRYHGWSPYRIFFHSELPKVEFQLKISYTIENRFKFQFLNNCLPQDTLFEKNENLNDAVLVWNFQNLPAIGNLWNSKLYEELPHVKLYRAGLLVASDGPGINERILEYNWSFALAGYAGIKKNYDGYDRRWESIEALNALYAEVINRTTDTSYMNKVIMFHNLINNEFTYKDDKELISGEDDLNLRLGKHVKEKKLRFVLKNKIYHEILSRMDRPYYLATYSDNRIDKIVPTKYGLGYTIGSIFVLEEKGEYFFMTPKSHQFGHHLNELPFYLENTNVLLVPQREPENKILNLGIAYTPKLIAIKTPISTEIENSRKTYSNIYLDFESNKLDFTTKLSLSGQFSTLTRGYYTHNYVDSSVSDVYYHKIYETSAAVKLSSQNKISEDSNFPFNTTFEFKYSDNSLLKHLHDSTYALDISTLIHHILENEISMNVCNSYYVDFRNTDIYRYYIKTSHPIRLIEKSEDFEINSAIGKFVFRITPKSETEILIDSYFQMSTDKVEPKDLKSLGAIQAKLTELQSANLKLVKKQ